ncbi:hypothetical protein [Methylobacterium flocculans]|jgi:hypothetical protein|uniref:hypothetical protein n=1 Tax=Methylobacterium flocculans TaxID=2984843 RepID=UPI0021F3A3C2|nr:hypothetical protein [Methylobacterium sp. FF17]
MEQPLSVRIDADQLAAARDRSRLDNRTLTNLIKAALIARIAATTAVRDGIWPTPPSGDPKGMNRGD